MQFYRKYCTPHYFNDTVFPLCFNAIPLFLFLVISVVTVLMAVAFLGPVVVTGADYIGP